MFRKKQEYILKCKKCGNSWRVTQKDITEYKRFHQAIISEKMKELHNLGYGDISFTQQSITSNIQSECKDPRVCLKCGTKILRKGSVTLYD